MKKIKSITMIVALTLLTICLGATLAACDFLSGGTNTNNKSASVNLYFDYEGDPGSEFYKYITIWQDNTAVQDPEEKTGYEFAGWFLDRDHTEKYDPSTYEIENSFELYGLFTKKFFTVNFVFNDEIVETQQAKYKEMISEPTVELEGYRILEWNNLNGERFNFYNDNITGDTTLYAVTEKLQYVVRAHTILTHSESRIIKKHGDSIKEELIKLENSDLSLIAEGWYFDEKFTEPVDLDTYSVTGYVDVYLKARYDLEYIYKLVKLDDGTYGISDLDRLKYLSGDYLLKDGVYYFPDSFVNRDGEECFISTLMTGASEKYRAYRSVVFGKHLVNIEKNAIGDQQSSGYQGFYMFYFTADKEKINVDENYLQPNSKGFVVAYFGEKIKQNKDFIYTDTGNDIVILLAIDHVNDVIVPRTIDGKPVTKINSCALNRSGNQGDRKVYLSNNIRAIQTRAIGLRTTIYCEFSESATASFQDGWYGGIEVTVLYNQEFPNTDAGTENDNSVSTEYAIIKASKHDNYIA